MIEPGLLRRVPKILGAPASMSLEEWARKCRFDRPGTKEPLENPPYAPWTAIGPGGAGLPSGVDVGRSPPPRPRKWGEDGSNRQEPYAAPLLADIASAAMTAEEQVDAAHGARPARTPDWPRASDEELRSRHEEAKVCLEGSRFHHVPGK